MTKIPSIQRENFSIRAKEKISNNLNAKEMAKNPKKIEAMVTTWGSRSSKDRRKFNYTPEAFKDFVERANESEKKIPMYFNHDEGTMPLGQWNEFEMTDKGLIAKGELFNTTQGNDMSMILKEGSVISEVSVSTYPSEWRWENITYFNDDGKIDEDGEYFGYINGSIDEISLVADPNNMEAKINSLEKRKLENTLKQIEGITAKMAKTIVSNDSINEMLIDKTKDESRDGMDSDLISEQEIAEFAVQLQLEDIIKCQTLKNNLK